MIKSCKYCLSQERVCDKCGEVPIIRTITVLLDNGELRSTTLTLCQNTECPEYGIFLKDTEWDFETIVCDKCKQIQKDNESGLQLESDTKL